MSGQWGRLSDGPGFIPFCNSPRVPAALTAMRQCRDGGWPGSQQDPAISLARALPACHFRPSASILRLSDPKLSHLPPNCAIEPKRPTRPAAFVQVNPSLQQGIRYRKLLFSSHGTASSVQGSTVWLRVAGTSSRCQISAGTEVLPSSEARSGLERCVADEQAISPKSRADSLHNR